MEITEWIREVQTAKMGLPLWYTIVTAAALCSWLLLRLVSRILNTMVAFSKFYILKHLIFPLISQRFPALGKRYQLLALVAYIAINVVCMTVGTTSSADISARAATMSLANIIPLLCGPRLVLIADVLGISLRAQYLSHTWLGLTAMTQALIHSILSVIRSHPFRWSKVYVTGVVVRQALFIHLRVAYVWQGSSALGVLLLLSVHFFRRLVYEWFLRSHLLLTAAVVLAAFLHLSSKKTVGKVFLGAAVALWTGVTLIHGMVFFFRNFARGRSLAVAQVSALPQALRIAIHAPRPWKVRAGQYIFLSIPTSGVMSAIQSHPFMIAWWERSGDGLTVYLLVKPRRGFTRTLAGLSDRSVMAFIDGPYGIDYSFGQYGTVLMFATGIGIAGQIPHIKEIVTGYNDCTVCSRRVILVWQLDKEAHEQWIKNWIDAAIELDTGHILDVRLYISQKTSATPLEVESPRTRRLGLGGLETPKVITYGTHRMFKKHFHSPNINKIFRTEFATRKGSMLVSVCADNVFAARVRKSVQRTMDKAVRLVELDFQPSLRKSHKHVASELTTDNDELDFSCRGEPGV